MAMGLAELLNGVPLERFILSPMIYLLMLTVFIKSTKNGGKLKSFTNPLSKIPA